MPVKRSQKLSDRITALQKLVSPYGKVSNGYSFCHPSPKGISLFSVFAETESGVLGLLQTDTASVLQEASLYIKLLQGQIRVRENNTLKH